MFLKKKNASNTHFSIHSLTVTLLLDEIKACPPLSVGLIFKVYTHNVLNQ